MKNVRYAKAARKALLRMPANQARRIVDKIDQLARDPASLAANIKALKNAHGALRLRVGDWRVIYLDGVVIDVIQIAPRGSVYE